MKDYQSKHNKIISTCLLISLMQGCQSNSGTQGALEGSTAASVQGPERGLATQKKTLNASDEAKTDQSDMDQALELAFEESIPDAPADETLADTESRDQNLGAEKAGDKDAAEVKLNTGSDKTPILSGSQKSGELNPKPSASPTSKSTKSTPTPSSQRTALVADEEKSQGVNSNPNEMKDIDCKVSISLDKPQQKDKGIFERQINLKITNAGKKSLAKFLYLKLNFAPELKKKVKVDFLNQPGAKFGVSGFVDSVANVLIVPRSHFFSGETKSFEDFDTISFSLQSFSSESQCFRPEKATLFGVQTQSSGGSETLNKLTCKVEHDADKPRDGSLNVCKQFPESPAEQVREEQNKSGSPTCEAEVQLSDSVKTQAGFQRKMELRIKNTSDVKFLDHTGFINFGLNSNVVRFLVSQEEPTCNAGGTVALAKKGFFGNGLEKDGVSKICKLNMVSESPQSKCFKPKHVELQHLRTEKNENEAQRLRCELKDVSNYGSNESQSDCVTFESMACSVKMNFMSTGKFRSRYAITNGRFPGAHNYVEVELDSKTCESFSNARQLVENRARLRFTHGQPLKIGDCYGCQFGELLNGGKTIGLEYFNTKERVFQKEMAWPDTRMGLKKLADGSCRLLLSYITDANLKTIRSYFPDDVQFVDRVENRTRKCKVTYQYDDKDA